MMTARFHCVFIMLVQCILYTKFGLFHRSKAYGSYLWVPDALLPIDFSMYLTKQNPIFLIGYSRGVAGGSHRGSPGALARVSGGPLTFAAKIKRGVLRGHP